MLIPNLNCIVDTYFRVKDPNFDPYISQLRTDLIPGIRKLQGDQLIIWYCFLMHGADQLAERVPKTDQNLYVHIRLGLKDGVDINEFKKQLPHNWEKPIKVQLAEISGLNDSRLKDKNWAYAWKLIGEASEWVVQLIENHRESISIRQVIQFLHFITNPLSIGNQNIFFPSGFLPF